MEDFGINEVLEMQRALQARYEGRWEPIGPETGKNKLLWMVGEIGEVADIVKKHGDRACEDPALRARLVEEMADVLMHYGDAMLCYGITAEELKDAFTRKHRTNLNRW